MTLENTAEEKLSRTARSDDRLPESSRGIHAVVAGLRGLQAGFVATLIMTAFRLPIMRSLPPSANFWSTYVGSGEPDDYPVVGLLLHLLYGTLGGAVFGGIFALLPDGRSNEPEQRGIVLGVVFGMLLSVFGNRIMLNKLLDIHLETDELTLFHAGHLVYGIALGAWVGSRTEGVVDPQKEYDYDSD